MSTTPSPPRRLTGDARRWTAARTEYLAGADPEVVCRRHDIRTATFLRLAGEQGWRRPDPAPAPAVQDDPLVIPEASQSPSGTPAPSGLTAARMADKAWSHVQTAIAAGRQIEARGWLRIHKDLQPFVRAEEAAESLARMDRDAAALRAVEEAPEEAVAPPLHCFSPSECNTPDQPDAPARQGEVAPSLHCFSPLECNGARSVTASGDRDDLALQLHCFSRPESNGGGPSP